MTVFDHVMELVENVPNVKHIRGEIWQQEEQLKEKVSEEIWNLFLNLEGQWVEYGLATAHAVFALAFLHGSQARYTSEEVFQLADIRERRILVAHECEDECMIWEGVQLTGRLAFVRVHHEQHLILCTIEPIPGSNVFRQGPPTDALLLNNDSLFPMIATDMFNLTFAQFARKHESLLMQALFS